MPTYSYRCAACGHDFTQYQAFTDDALTECPNCGKPELLKVFSNIGVTFKGSGFYRTDSRSGSAKKDAPQSTTPSTTKAASPSTPAAPAASTSSSS
ncbi:putative FmdB family regulatory protein [Homoserinimonas aerilata]|uniref:Putative FmdB family regulatory protein n=1 Tax=Homoserinimonas aerilata TaxID=1162970 RepID=A0A542YGC7_9MICO|nr:FmdB family zinc ribbon protein [Homoserinimonas aerilata]TQL47133.1 putative FmdB family regulatory protein [Homoserinimonas aerilata]